MAAITKIKDSFRVQIRKKNIEISKTFNKEEDAILWAKYKENLIDCIEVFDVPLKEMVTLREAIELKINALSSAKKSKDIQDIKILLI